MSDDLVKAEVHAVRSLRHGLERYAAQIRDAMLGARREMAVADDKAREVAKRRRSELHRREHELAAAQAALAQCRENCGGLQQQLGLATRRHAEAKQALERALRGVQLVASTQSDLLKVLRSVENTVGQQSSIASSALATLDAKLAELPHFDLGRAVHNVVVGTALSAEILGASIDLGRVAGNALQAANVMVPLQDHSITQMVEHRQEQEIDYVVENDLMRQERASSGEDRETVT